MFLVTRGFLFVALTIVLLLSGEIDKAQPQAQTPSNTCAHERTECLRARVQKGILGSEYVPPDDAGRCNEAYKACLSGAGSGQQKSVQPATRPPYVDINGAWGSNIGVDYQITQTGNSFRWVCGIPGETGNGTIDGNKVSASWSGPKGSGSASGVVVIAGRSTKIEWSNGVRFLKR